MHIPTHFVSFYFHVNQTIDQSSLYYEKKQKSGIRRNTILNSIIYIVLVLRDQTLVALSPALGQMPPSVLTIRFHPMLFHGNVFLLIRNCQGHLSSGFLFSSLSASSRLPKGKFVCLPVRANPHDVPSPVPFLLS